MVDRIHRSFLLREHEEAMALAAECDLLDLELLGDPDVPRRYLARFAHDCLVRDRRNGEIGTAHGFSVGFYLPPDYQEHVVVPQIVTWLEPENAFHANIRWPFICVGDVRPGTSLVSLILQVHEIGTAQIYTANLDDCLNPVACAWMQKHPDRLPTDRRALKPRRGGFEISISTGRQPA
ncbi:MAG: hypothetical protein ACE5GW_04585 [Planctomycetota bacterium]